MKKLNYIPIIINNKNFGEIYVYNKFLGILKNIFVNISRNYP